MASLHIKNIGPILDSTKIELTPLMVLICSLAVKVPVRAPL